jgi:hypothetical protein
MVKKPKKNKKGKDKDPQIMMEQPAEIQRLEGEKRALHSDIKNYMDVMRNNNVKF